MSSKHLSVQLFPAPDRPVMMMSRSRSPAPGSAWRDLAGGLDKLHRAVEASSQDVHRPGTLVPEDEKAVGAKAQLVDRLLDRHRLRVGPAHHDGSGVADRLRRAARSRGSDRTGSGRPGLPRRDALLPSEDLRAQGTERLVDGAMEIGRLTFPVEGRALGAERDLRKVAMALGGEHDAGLDQLGDEALHLRDLGVDAAPEVRGGADAATAGQVDDHAPQARLRTASRRW